ncbi:MAG: hypothetical protein JWQ57_709 [Mucilaginibacter sp.]|nr:hypothetical protein [Mucilaginibacter sp.]
MLILIGIVCVISSCKKINPVKDPGKCVHATDGLIVKKWKVLCIQTDTYNASGAKTTTTHDHPAGFIQFNSSGSYTAASDGLTVNGKWLFDNNCNLGLTGGGNDGITFDIVKLTTDSLTIRKKIGDNIITQYFASYSCSCQCYLEKKWINAYTEEDTYSSDGSTVTGTTTIHPIGFFELNSDSTYRVVSNNVPLNGKWKANSSFCELTLDTGTSRQRTFEIVKANDDSLVIRRKEGNVAYIQHYAAYKCPTLAQLEQTWDNIDIRIDYVTNGSFSGSSYVYPIGYFRLNANATYNVDSNGVPLDGSWQLLDQSHGCPLVLDAGTSIQRSFDVTQITGDSLTIYREDLSNGAAYIQRYKKH